MEDGKTLKVLMTYSEMDSHDRGIRNQVQALRDAGMEVIFTRYGLPEEIMRTALEEDVDVIGISFSTGGHMVTLTELKELLNKEKLGDVTIIIGGIIPDKDIPAIKSLGIEGIFGPGSSPQDTIAFIKQHVKKPEAKVG